MGWDRMAGIKANLPWIGVLVVLGLLPFLGVLASGDILFASDQIGSPQWKFYFDALHRGEIPLWNGLSLGGMPTFDALVGDPSYPLFNLVGFFTPVEKLHTVNFILHVIIAGCTAYFLMRAYFRLDRFLSLALAAAYMLNTNFISLIYSGHSGKFFIIAWLPLALYFLLRCLRPDARWTHLLGLALLVTLFVTTSHLQFTYFVLMGFFLYWAFVTTRLVRAKDTVQAGLGAGRFWLPILLGLGLAFPIVYAPMQYNLNYSVRGESPRKTLEHATSWSIHPEEAVGLVVPEFSGINENYWGRNAFKLNSEYPGLAVLFLGLFGLLAFRKAWFWFWASVGLLAIVYGLGAHTPLFTLFYHLIPGVKSFRAPSMILFWLAAALLLMAAQTLRLLTKERSSLPPERLKVLSGKLAKWGFGAAGLLALAGLASGATYGIYNAFISPQEVSNFANQGRNMGAFTFGALRSAAVLALLVFAVRKWLLDAHEPRFFAVALLGAVLGDLYLVDRHFIGSYPLDRYFPREQAVEYLKQEKASSGPFRVMGVGNAYPKGYMPYHGIETIDGWTDQEYSVYRAYRGGDYHQNPNWMLGLKQNPDGTVEGSRFLDMLNVKYVAFRVPDAPGLQLAPNKSALPRVWFVTSWESDHDSLILERMKGPDFDPAAKALVSLTTPVTPREKSTAAPAATAPKASVSETVRRSNTLAYKVEAPAEGLLVLSELWFPHWKTTVDGEPAEDLRVDFAFRGVKLGPGTHEVEFRYESSWLRKGFLASGASLVLLLGGLVLYRRLPGPKDPARAGDLEG
ncbi:MAG TPA: hypothetical protein VK465_06070 [Fibrobacteria bacterium]|nr:hypothetical protein [Fibrobacteria bacterium]